MSKIARVKFIRDKEPNIKALTAENKVLDGALYVATDTGTLWMGISSSSLIQIKDNINTNTTYNLTKSGSTITLRGSDGSTFNVTDSNTVYGNATASAAGLMSAADKAKLDGVAAGSNRVTIDAELSTTSTNPVQNKVIKSALDGKSNTGHTHDDRYYTESEINTKLNAKANSSHTHTKAQITDFPTSMPASDVYAWAKAASKPSYTIGEVSGNLPASRISGTIAAANLPSYVDDVLEYASLSKFPTKGESGKIYTALDTNKIYRWSGSEYVVISETIALGITHSSAGYGDESRAAYNHSTKTSGNPHHVTKIDVGLGNVDNTADSAKSVKYATSAGSAGSVAWSNVSGRPSSMPASDVYAWAKAASKPSYTIGEVSGNLPASRISGTIAAANLPSYVDDVLEYASLSKFPTKGESGKIYTALDTNKIYRWSGSEYVVISETIALGITHSSAGYGDESRAAYNHSTKTSGNPHHVTKIDVGLGNVDNTADSAKSVKYATSAGSAGSVAWSNVSGRPSSMPASDVYSWAKQPNKPSYTASEVGAAPASHSHSYLPLAGGTVTGRINRGAGGHFISARNNVVVFGTATSPDSYNPVVGQKTPKGSWTIGNLSSNEHLVFSYDTDTNFNAGTNSSNTTYLPVGGHSQEIITSATIGSQSVSHANSADSVAWNNVSGRPSSMPASDVYAWAKASSKPSYSWSEISGKPTIPSIGNGTVTITQNGATKGTFTLNQAGDATIALTDNNTVYSLPTATSSVLGGVKVGSNITNSSGTISLTKANVTAALGYTPPTSDTNTWRPEEVIISSTQPSASTCKLWIKF